MKDASLASPVAAWLSTAAVLVSGQSARGEARPGAIVTIGLRYDDCTALSDEGLERRVLEICARNRVPVTFGVVPEIGAGNNRDPAPAGNLPLPRSRQDMLVEYRDRGYLEIALHGYAHQSAHRDRRSEFAGVPLEKQKEILAKGKAELEAFAGPVQSFIPPWNSYDRNTLAALSANGLKVLSAAADGEAIPGLGMRHVHATCLVPDLRKAVEAARAAGGGIVIPYFHPYEFKESDAKRGFMDFTEFEAALAWAAAQPDVQTLTLSAIAERPEAAPEIQAAYARWARLLPPFLEKTLRPAFWVYPRPAFPIPGGGLWFRLAGISWYLILAGAGFLAAFGPGRLALAAAALPAAWARLGLGLGGLALAAALIGWISAAFPLASAGAALFGLGLGIWRLGGG